MVLSGPLWSGQCQYIRGLADHRLDRRDLTAKIQRPGLRNHFLGRGYIIPAKCNGFLIPDIKTSSGLIAYPNPTNGKLTVVLPETKKPGSALVEVCGLFGQPLLQQRFEPLAPVEIDLALQPPGIYILKVTRENQAFVVKIIRQ